MNGEISPADPLTERGDGAATSGAGVARKVAHLTPGERVARGKAARNEVPRSSHGRWEPAVNRPDPVGLLEEQAASRVPELVPIRYGRMLVSPFTFYRGAALIMAADLAATPRSGLHVQICGDAHLSNFGVFASPERQLMFDINDFDETLPGPWEWDVKRLAASFEIAGRDRGFTPAERRAIVLAMAENYRTRMKQAAGMRNLDIWYAHIEVEALFEQLQAAATKKQQAKARANLAKARTKDSMQAFAKLTHEVDGERRIIADPPLIVPIEDLLPPGRERDEIEGRSAASSGATGAPLRPTGGTCWRTSTTSTWPGRWSASAASARAPGFCSCSGGTTRTRCSCRPKKPRNRCWNGSSARASTPTAASASSPGNA